MRFVNLKTGNIYNGDAPYIHWFKDNQSTNLIYAKKICVLHDNEKINISLNSDIFSLLNISNIKVDEEIINDFTYKNIDNFKCDNFISNGFLYNIDSQNIYLHMIYIICNSKNEGEFLEDLYIDNEKFIIGASFYDKYEPHSINLSNFGVELPDIISRAIYETNVHEEYNDNVLLNRKYKEILNEYWNIIANKGSYKSLYNSLAWFEYGDLIKIKEFWKNPDFYNQQDILTSLKDNITGYLSNQIKSTYIGLYLSLQKFLVNDSNNVVYDKLINNHHINGDLEEYNAILDKPINGDNLDHLDQIFQISAENIDEVGIFEDIENDGIDYSDWYKMTEEDDDFMIDFITEDEPYANLDKSINGDDLDHLDQIFQIGNTDDANVYIYENDNSDGMNHSDWYRVKYSDYEGFIGEENPILIKVAKKWSNEDLCLKMYLVGNFFETYFTPIHLDVIHSTVEDIVFTNTIKIIHENNLSRTDYFNNIHTFNCNIKNNDIFFLDDVNTQVGKDTIAGIQWLDVQDSISNESNIYDLYPTLGVSRIISKIETDNNLKTFASQYYNSSGVIIPFKCKLDLKDNDIIKKATICLTELKTGYCIKHSFKLLHNDDIEFYILCKFAGNYRVDIDFATSNFNYIKNINFTVYDNTNKNIKLYKVKYNTKYDHNDKSKYLSVSDYLLSHYNYSNKNQVYKNIINKKIISQYIPERLNQLSDKDFDGVWLNKTIIVQGYKHIYEIIEDKQIADNSKVLYKYKYDIENNILTDEVTYTIVILPHTAPADVKIKIDKSLLIRNDFVFYPEYHHLEELYNESSTPKIEDFLISSTDVLMVVPNINYLKYIDENSIEWEFENISLKNKKKPIILPSIKTPFIANTDYELLEPGYYNIKFRYKIDKTVQEITLNSAFCII